MSIADNVARVREAVNAATARAGIHEEVTLVAAAKMNDADAVRQAILAGVDAVGENRAQEMTQKRSIGAYDGVPLHFIGHLQKNKVKYVVGVCDLIESVGSLPLLEAVGKRARDIGVVQDVLIEVNIGAESAKTGVLPEEAEQLLSAAASIGTVRILGLMAIPPFETGFDGNHRYFDAMYKLFVDMSAKKYDNVSMQLLSMGMSDSFEDAILAGANVVRVGSAIFGRRVYNR